jgi:O-methyltransferase
MDKVVLVKGPVENTIPATVADRISLLRLDTDWYSSTKHEIEHLYARLSPHGVLILDDHGHYRGAQQAIERIFRSGGEASLPQSRRLLLPDRNKISMFESAEPVAGVL